MKNYLLLLILLATSMPSAAQMVTSLQLPYTAGYATAPRYRVHRLVCATTKIGAALTVTGPVVFFVGKGLIEDYAHNQNLDRLKTGAVLYGTGLVFTCVGAGMLIGGGVHDIVLARQRQESERAQHERRRNAGRLGYLGLYSNGYNEAGLAYHF